MTNRQGCKGRQPKDPRIGESFFIIKEKAGDEKNIERVYYIYKPLRWYRRVNKNGKERRIKRANEFMLNGCMYENGARPGERRELV